MSKNTTPIRITTIQLDEYNNLKDTSNSLREKNGVLKETINNLTNKIAEIKETNPKIEVIHSRLTFDDYDEEFSKDTFKREYINLSEVTNLAKEDAEKEVKDKITTLEDEANEDKSLIKALRNNVETVQDRVDVKERQLKKAKETSKIELEDAEESYNKNVKLLTNAATKDAESYKETIKELKEDIKKIKDNKTDLEVEKKRNQEIKDLKSQIKELETTIEDLGKLNLVNRVFKLRTLSAERIEAQKQLIEKKRRVDNIGTTWVKENGKIREYDSFKSITEKLFNPIREIYYGWRNPDMNLYRS